MSDIISIKRMLESRALDVAQYLLPRGRLDKRDWCIGSVSGEVGSSLKVCVQGAKAGIWADFAEGGESGGDLIDLWCAVRGRKLSEALNEIRSYLGVEIPQFEKPNRSWRRPEKPKCTAPRSAVLTYLRDERRVSATAIQAYRVAEDGRFMILPMLSPEGELINVKHRAIDREPGKQPKTWTEADCEPILFGWQAIPDNLREVVLCEGEIDALTFYDFGFPALSVPFGGGKGGKQQWIESDYDRLLRFETIYLALDMDATGDAATQAIADRLGRHRCKRVKLPHKDVNDCAKAGMISRDIARLIEAAENLDPPELRRAGDFTAEVLEIFWPAGGVEVGYRLPWGKIGSKLLFRPGEMTVWTGASSAGKSQILSHASVAWGDQGAKVCIASLEMHPRHLLKRMVKQAGNVDRPTEAFTRAIMRWLNEWVWCFNVIGKSGVARMLEIFEYARARYGCDTFIVDSLMRLGVGPEDYDGQEKAVYEIVNWAVAKNIHIHLVAHARKSDRAHSGVPEIEDIKGTSETGANAFNIVSIWRNQRHEDDLAAAMSLADKGDVLAQDRVKELSDIPPVILNVAKQRNGDWSGKVGLWFDRATYQYRSADDNRYGTAFVHLDDSCEGVA